MPTSKAIKLSPVFVFLVIAGLLPCPPAAFPFAVPDPCAGGGCGCIGPDCDNRGTVSAGDGLTGEGRGTIPPPPTPRELAQAAFDTGNYHYRLGNWAEAERYYREALGLFPELGGEIHYRLGSTLEARQRYEEALVWYRQARNLGVQSISDGKSDIERIEEILARVAARRQAADFNAAGLRQYGQGNFAEALELFRNGLRLDPGNPALQKNRVEADNALAKGRSRAASTKIEGAIARQIEAMAGERSAGEVDLSFIDPERTPAVDPGTLPAAETRSGQGLIIKEVPSPFGYRSQDERAAQLATLTGLSEDELARRIARSKRTLEQLRDDFLQGERELQAWLAESQDAEEKALLTGFKMLAAAALKLPPGRKMDDRALHRIRQLTEYGLKLLDYGEPLQKLSENPADRQARLELARNATNDLYDFLREQQGGALYTRKVSELGPEYAGFGGFVVDYLHEAGRWAVAGSQIRSITAGIDQPGGKLAAQLELKRVLEDLLNEKKRRGEK